MFLGSTYDPCRTHQPSHSETANAFAIVLLQTDVHAPIGQNLVCDEDDQDQTLDFEFKGLYETKLRSVHCVARYSSPEAATLPGVIGNRRHGLMSVKHSWRRSRRFIPLPARDTVLRGFVRLHAHKGVGPDLVAWRG